MRISKRYEREIKTALLAALVALAMPDMSWAQAVDFNAGQTTFAGTELSAGPMLAAAIAYVAGTIFAFAGIVKLKAHSENPGQTPLAHGIGRLCAGGALLALPTVTGLISSTISTGTGATEATYTATNPALQ